MTRDYRLARSHPAGVVLTALLFGVLYQGGTELAFYKPSISRDMIVVNQGLVILFAGALEFMFEPWLARLLCGIGAVPVQAIQVLPYVITVVLLAGFVGRAIPPKASGIPYVKER